MLIFNDVSKTVEFFQKNLPKNLHRMKKGCNFALAIGKQTPVATREQLNGAVVQLVRMPACHAGGRGFKSRPHRRGERKSSMVNFGCLLLFFVSFFMAICNRPSIGMFRDVFLGEDI